MNDQASVRRRPGRKAVSAFIAVAALLIGLRAAAPWLVRQYVNRTLDRLPNYDGRIGDVDLNLWRGAYEIESLELVKTSGEVPVPLLDVREIDLSVEWRQIFRGALVGEIHFYQPRLNLVAGPSEEETQTGADEPWTEVVRDLFPLRINRLEVHDGEIRYRDFHSDPKVDVPFGDVRIVAQNLTNSRDLSGSLVATVRVTAHPFDRGHLRTRVKLDPYADPPSFDSNFELEEIQLSRLNDVFRAYGGFDVEKGQLDVYAELAASDGSFRGYVKPLMTGVEIVDWEERAESVLQQLWEAVVGVTFEIFENQPSDRFATRIPLSGRFDQPQTGTLAAILAVLWNAFIDALPPRLEGSVGAGDESEQDEDQKNGANGSGQSGDDSYAPGVLGEP